MADTYDLVVIGAGPGGYVAAIRAAQLGMKVACVEKAKTLGGTCLNVGCIPSKAMLDSSEHYHYAKSKLSKHGVMVGDVKLDLPSMMKRKEGVVRQLTNGVAGLFKKHKIEHVLAHGKLVAGGSGGMHRVQAGDRTLEAKRVIIATGSEPTELPFLKYDRKRVVDSTGALEFPEVPRHLVVIGAGVIGLELGSVWLRLGAKVTVVEYNTKILSAVDGGASNELYKSLLKQGMEFKLGTKCLGAKVDDRGAVIQMEEISTGTKAQLECDYVLVATGRRPYTEGLGLDELGIPRDKMGRVEVDAHYETKVKGIFAIGDVIAGPMLAHKAEDEGVACVEMMAGQKSHVYYDAIPNVVYTWPELASVGASEEELKAKGVEYRAGQFPFIANGRAKAMDELEGFVKLLADAKTDRLLGAHIVGPRASDMIPELVAVMEYGGSSEDIARTCHAHPTLAEVVKEAALAVDKRQLHL